MKKFVRGRNGRIFENNWGNDTLNIPMILLEKDGVVKESDNIEDMFDFYAVVKDGKCLAVLPSWIDTVSLKQNTQEGEEIYGMVVNYHPVEKCPRFTSVAKFVNGEWKMLVYNNMWF